jgi:hypothetical protein
MLELENVARGMGLRQLGLHVFAFNDGARALYDGLGYSVASRNMLKDLWGCGAAPGPRPLPAQAASFDSLLPDRHCASSNAPAYAATTFIILPLSTSWLITMAHLSFVLY